MMLAPRRGRAAVLVLTVLALTLPACARREPATASLSTQSAADLRLRETTVRNVTDHAITYRIYPARTSSTISVAATAASSSPPPGATGRRASASTSTRP